MTPLQFHPYAEIFPLLTGAEFDAFVEDIRLQQPASRICDAPFAKARRRRA